MFSHEIYNSAHTPWVLFLEFEMTFRFIDSCYWINVFQVNLMLIFVWIAAIPWECSNSGGPCSCFPPGLDLALGTLCCDIFCLTIAVFYETQILHKKQNAFIQSIALSFNLTLRSKQKILAFLAEIFWYFMFDKICVMFWLFEWVLAHSFNKKQCWNIKWQYWTSHFFTCSRLCLHYSSFSVLSLLRSITETHIPYKSNHQDFNTSIIIYIYSYQSYWNWRKHALPN